MNPGQLIARHFATGQPVRVSWDDGRISRLEVCPETPPPDWRIAPALVDLQVNGYAGVDFQQDNLPLDALLSAARHLARAGCTRWLLTLITDDWSRLTARLQHLRDLRERAPTLQKAIAGWHVEGPFLSAEPGFCGAHPPSCMIDPSPDRIRQLRAITGQDPLLLTLAPERAGALEAIALATSLGITVSLGHTDAPAGRLAEAVAAGARAFTHLGNGCPRALDRHDNILWRVLENRALTISLIPDAIHVSAPLFRLIHRLLPDDRIVYVTDAMAAAGAPPGRYPLGRLELEVGPDQVVRLPGHPNFAGSALRPIDGIRRAATLLNAPWPGVWPRFSTAPAALLRLPAALAPGAPADFCLVQTDEAGALRQLRTFAGGIEVGDP